MRTPAMAEASFSLAAVERASAGRSLKLPRVPHRGRLGDVRAASVGSALELHDFRGYHPGDDLRHVDWNAVARTGELVVRVRQDEVSPRVEIILDGSASMAVSPEKAARAKEISLWLCELALHGGCEPVLLLAGTTVRKVPGVHARLALVEAMADSSAPFDATLRRLPPLLPCGLRVVVSDFLVEAAPGPLAEQLSRHAAGTVFVQVMDVEDLDPSEGAGTRLVDAESSEALERILTKDLIDGYKARLAAHVAAWQSAAQRVSARWIQVSAGAELDAQARRELSPLVEAA